ncbi:hypothetical protein RchiOBHm_Chr6g0274971 [Rosa chinensis]|uniref:Uncharacterized protein n=1 Tax=Rosa chinensis TaxID=74649 RepID=A0A2P6PRV3_ROSCH|nr:hypothetical protein RchiOBHm_Chr6g0274971 [Rosa chinensis]
MAQLLPEVADAPARPLVTSRRDTVASTARPEPKLMAPLNPESITRRRRSTTNISKNSAGSVLLLLELMLCMRSIRQRKTRSMPTGTRLKRRSLQWLQLEPVGSPSTSTMRRKRRRKRRRKKRKRLMERSTTISSKTQLPMISINN